jgi:predicted transposase YbfD/YdcC
MIELSNILSNIFFSFIESFSRLEDPRVEGLTTYPMDEILFGVLCGILCGCDDFEEIALFGKDNIEYLRKYFPYKNGMPKEAWLTRIFSMIDGDRFEKCFVSFLSSLKPTLKVVIAIDGKTLCGSRHKNRKAIHIVSAFMHEEGIIVGQKKVSEKSNEITAIPLLLDEINIEGCTVTIDAMGCQKNIAAKIIEKKADYVLSLKGNQGNLHEEIERFFSRHKGCNFKNRGYEFDISEETDAGHGRIEVRKVVAIDDINWLTFNYPDWDGLTSIAMVESTRIMKGKEVPATTEKRYYISSMKANAKKIGKAIRAHWSVENNLHWVMDVAFNEDKCRSRKDDAALNFGIIRRAAFNMLKMENTKMSIKCKRKKASWDCEYLTKVLTSYQSSI